VSLLSPWRSPLPSSTHRRTLSPLHTNRGVVPASFSSSWLSGLWSAPSIRSRLYASRWAGVPALGC